MDNKEYINLFKDYVHHLTGSDVLTEQAEYNLLNDGTRGDFTNLEEYGLSMDKVVATGLWDSDKNNITDYLKAVVEALHINKAVAPSSVVKFNSRCRLPESLLSDEPVYYALNGLSPLKAFEKGLLSHEEYMGFLKGNIIKYTVRCDKKGGSEDMDKCIDYAEHLKEIL